MSHKLQHLSMFLRGLSITRAMPHTHLCYHIEKSHMKYCQALRAYSCATVTINTLPLSSKSAHECWDWHYTQKPRHTLWLAVIFVPYAVGQHDSGDCSLNWLHPRKACDHLSCQPASAETTNQSFVRLALKISQQKMCHLQMFRTQRQAFPCYFC